MSIPSSFIDQILDQSDIVDIIGRRVQLNKKGNNFWGICPFHDDTNPSMAVNQDKQFYYCFVCNAKGNSINFLRNYENLDFVDAVESIASSVGLEVPRTHKSVDTKEALSINARAVGIYEEQLKADTGNKAVDYLKSRSITGETAKIFNIGYALDEWEGLFEILSKEYKQEDLSESGLFSEKMKDRFRGRLMFPIRNIKGDHIAFGGRIIDEGEPKYLNSPETKTFSKSKELYGLYEARKLNNPLQSVFVVEGYMDVIALHQNGVKNAVASLGTAITGLHISKLMRYSKNIYVAFDGDLAGRKAAWRVVENALPILREDINIKFIFLDEGHDPDSFINEKGKQAFLDLSESAISFSQYFLDTVKEQANLETIEGRSIAAKFAVPLISKINNQPLKEAYIDEVSKVCSLDFAKLLTSSSSLGRVEIQNEPNNTNPKTSSQIAKKAVLGIFTSLIQHPKLAAEIIFDDIKQDSKFYFIHSIRDKFKNNPESNPSIVFESIEKEPIKNVFSEALISDINLSLEDAKKMIIDCINTISKSEKDREEILKEKYNMQEISSAEKRELQQVILKKENISEADQNLLRNLSTVSD